MEWGVYDTNTNVVKSDSLYRFTHKLWVEVVNFTHLYNSKEEVLKNGSLQNSSLWFKCTYLDINKPWAFTADYGKNYFYLSLNK
jgi:hypothetical protein